MAKKNLKNTLYILETTGIPDSQSFLHTNIDIDSIYVIHKKSNTAILINPNFYNQNKLYTYNAIANNYPESVSNIVLSSSEFLKHLSSIFALNKKYPNVHFNKSCELGIDMFKDVDLNNFGSFTFENNVSYTIAQELLKKNITFHTTTNYPLLDHNKFSANNNLITQSDYYQALTLNVNGVINEDDIVALNMFFDMNRILYSIKIDADMKSVLDIVKAYTSNISKYSHATFDIQLPDIILDREENKYLYEIHKLLKANNCKLNLISPTKEIISFESYSKTLTPLRKFANKILALNLSPLEKLVLIEDFTKSRPYTDSSNKAASRKFFHSRNSNYIVCYTYATTFKALCDYTNIPCAISIGRLTTDGGKVSEHAKLICNIEDTKYNKHGLYIFEPTFDAAKIDKDYIEEPCDNYLYFANTFDEYKDSYLISTKEFGLLSKDTDTVNQEECIKQLYELYGTEFIIEHGSRAIDIAQSVLDNSEHIDIDTFKSILTTARCSIGEFDENDMERIIQINTEKAAQNISRFSSNRFVKAELFDCDNTDIFDCDI